MVVRNKRGQFFSLYLVLLTLLMCGVVIGTYVLQKDGLENSLVSPNAVLEIRDKLDVFELREVELIKSSLNSASGTFPEDDFIDSFRSVFIAGFMADEDMKNFILANLTWDGKSFEEAARAKFQNFLEGGLYTRSLTRAEGGNLIFTRARVIKTSLLEGEDKTKINFPVEFSFDLGGEYVIDSSFEVTKR